MPRRLLFCVVGLVVGLISRAIAADHPAFSFTGGSWVGVVALLGAGWSLVVAAVMFSARRPHNLTAVLLVGVSVGWFVAEWDSPGAGSSPVFTAGLVLATACPAAVTWLMLAHPSGRLTGWIDRSVVAVAVATAVALGVLPALYFEPADAGCRTCPNNLLAVRDDPVKVADLSRAGLRVVTLAILAAVIVALLRLVRSSPARRHLDAPIVVPCIAYLIFTAWTYVRGFAAGFVAGGAAERALWFSEAAALTTLSLSVAWGGLRARRMRASVARIVVRLDQPTGRARLRDTFARVLGAEDLEVAYPLDDGSHVDADGLPVDMPPEGGQSATPLVRGGRTVAVLLHQRGLLDNTVALEEVAEAAQLALENERLRAELRAQEHELLASRSRIVEAGDAERRRLERDVHDGAQQRLVALLFWARLAQAQPGDRPSPSAKANLDRLAGELQQAIDELRDIAHGIHPAVLTDEGLEAAIECLADSTTLEVGLMPDERFAASVENAAYRVIAESARTGPTRVVAARRGTALVLDVTTASRPDAIVELEDRIGAVNGSILVGAGDGTEVTLHVEIPCA